MVRGRAGCDDQAPVMGIGAALDLPGRPAVIEPRGHRRGWPWPCGSVAPSRGLATSVPLVDSDPPLVLGMAAITVETAGCAGPPPTGPWPGHLQGNETV